jgi:hypothetical protein
MMKYYWLDVLSVSKKFTISPLVVCENFKEVLPKWAVPSLKMFSIHPFLENKET